MFPPVKCRKRSTSFLSYCYFWVISLSNFIFFHIYILLSLQLVAPHLFFLFSNSFRLFSRNASTWIFFSLGKLGNNCNFVSFFFIMILLRLIAIVNKIVAWPYSKTKQIHCGFHHKSSNVHLAINCPTFSTLHKFGPKLFSSYLNWLKFVIDLSPKFPTKAFLKLID